MEIRAATREDAAEMANVHVNSWREAYSELLPVTFLNDLPLSFKRRHDQWKRVLQTAGQATFVAACDEYGVIGFINGAHPRDSELGDHAEVWCLYLLEKFHRQGIGFRLLQRYLSHFHAQGLRRAYVWVLDGNPAIQFYERTGARANGMHKDIEMAGKKLRELCYVWWGLDGIVNPAS